MRGSANLWSFRSLSAIAALATLLLAARAECQPAPSADGPLQAILRPVNRATGAANPDISLGTATFTKGKSGVEVTFQVFGISVGGSEEGAAADGTGNVYPRTVVIFSGTCEAATKGGTSGGERLPDLNVRDDGSGTGFSTTKTDLAKLVGQTVVISKPAKPGAATGVVDACGVIEAKK
jgi:hypothetical protein